MKYEHEKKELSLNNIYAVAKKEEVITDILKLKTNKEVLILANRTGATVFAQLFP